MRLAATILIGLAAAGCTASVAPGPPTPSAPPVTCQDSRGPTLAGEGRTFGPVEFQGLQDGAVDVPKAAQVGVRLPHDDWYFRKLPLAIGAGTGTVTITTSSESVSTAWTTGSVWTSGTSPVDLRPSAGPSLTIERCPDVGNYLYGGLAAADPTECFALTVAWQEGSTPQSETQRLNLAGTPCA